MLKQRPHEICLQTCSPPLGKVGAGETPALVGGIPTESRPGGKEISLAPQAISITRICFLDTETIRDLAILCR